MQEEVPYQTQACFKTEFPLKKKKRHLRQTVFISISHIIRNYCATLTIIINTNNVQSLLSGQSDIMLQYIQISKAFWESRTKSTFPMMLNNLWTQYVTMKMSWNMKVLRHWPVFGTALAITWMERVSSRGKES